MAFGRYQMLGYLNTSGEGYRMAECIHHIVVRVETIKDRPSAVIAAVSRHADLFKQELGMKFGSGVEKADVQKPMDHFKVYGANSLQLIGTSASRACRHDLVHTANHPYVPALCALDTVPLPIIKFLPCLDICLETEHQSESLRASSGASN